MPASPNDVGNLELRDYMTILRRRKALIGLVTALVVLLVVGFSITRTPVYEARAQVLIQQREGEAVLGGATRIDEEAVNAEMALMRSGQIQRAIEDNLGYLPEPRLSAASGATPGVNVYVSDSDPEAAAGEANDFANAYVAERRRIITEDLRASITEVELQMTNLVNQVADTREEIQVLLVQADQTTDPAAKRVLEAQIEQLTSQVEPGAVAGRRANFQSQLDRLNAALAANAGGGRYLVALATEPEQPSSPRPVRDAGIALAVGLMLGLTAAFLRDYFDDTLRTKEDLDATTGGVPVLGIIPSIDEWRDRKAALLEAVSHPNSAASEAYRSLRTSIEFIAVDQKIGVIHVTSSTSGEGKSTTSANLAVTLARAGKRVILIDCDLRRPRLHQFFGMDNAIGFTSVVLGSTRIEDALEPVPGVPGLLVLPSGPPPPNPSELLSTKTVQNKFEALARSADYVVIDSPPLLPVSDSVVLAGLADLTLLVVTARVTAKRSLNRSIEMLDQVDAPLGGIVFNGVGSEGTYGYGYGYAYSAYAPKGRGRKGDPNRSPYGSSSYAPAPESNGHVPHRNGHDPAEGIEADDATEPASAGSAAERD